MASGVTFKLDGVTGLQKHFSEIQSSGRVLQAVRQATAIVESTAKHLAPSGSGELRGKIHMATSQSGQAITGRVYTNCEHAMYVEFGTGHLVGQGTYPADGVAALAKHGVNLSYTPKDSWVYTPDNGAHFYTTSGYRARPFMYPALKQNKTRIKQLIINAVRKDVK